jgi:hypothetical protein
MTAGGRPRPPLTDRLFFGLRLCVEGPLLSSCLWPGLTRHQMGTDKEASNRLGGAKFSQKEQVTLRAGFRNMPKSQLRQTLKALSTSIEVLKQIEETEGSTKSSKKTRSKVILIMTVVMFVGAVVWVATQEFRFAKQVKEH